MKKISLAAISKLAVVATFLLAPALAGAQAITLRPPPSKNPNPTVFGIPVDSVGAGFGYSNWTGDAAPMIHPGVEWQLNIVMDVSQPVGLELQYMGSSNGLDGDLSEFNLYMNELQILAKVQPILIMERIKPFLSVGLGLTRVSFARNPDLNQVFLSDTMGSVPLAAGATYRIIGPFEAGLRVQWDILFDNEILTQQRTTDGDRWGLLVHVGLSGFNFGSDTGR